MTAYQSHRPVSVRHLTTDDVGLLESLLATFGEAMCRCGMW